MNMLICVFLNSSLYHNLMLHLVVTTLQETCMQFFVQKQLHWICCRYGRFNFFI